MREMKKIFAGILMTVLLTGWSSQDFVGSAADHRIARGTDR